VRRPAFLDEAFARSLNRHRQVLVGLRCSEEKVGVERLNDFDIALNHAVGRNTFGFFECELQGLARVLFVGSDGGDADRGALPYVLVIGFGNGDIEFGAEPVLEAADDHALVFERLRMGDVDLEREQGDGDYRTPATFSVMKASMTSPSLRSLKL
jgi:hypothetical protein